MSCSPLQTLLSEFSETNVHYKHLRFLHVACVVMFDYEGALVVGPFENDFFALMFGEFEGLAHDVCGHEVGGHRTDFMGS